MVELTDAEVHQDTVMVILVDAPFAFVTMSHSHPFD